MDYNHRRRRSRYEKIIVAHRDTLSEDDMELLLLFTELPSGEAVARKLDISQVELTGRVAAVMEKYGAERLTKDGKPYKKRLGRSALIEILTDHPDLDEYEQSMIRALIDAPNKVVAAHTIGKTFSVYEIDFRQMRRKHNF